jgi:hypothetical protein
MGGSIEFAFNHETPVLLNLVIVLLIARLVWTATWKQRAVSLFVPLLIYAQMVTERRAGWVALDLGLVLIAIFTFRTRRRVFYFCVLPLAVMYLGYLAAFWNAEGPIAQPARAVRSINDPEGRDVASNLYRQFERNNIRLNIKANPITGLGFGMPYVFYYGMPDLSWWPFWHYIPHNAVMFLWMDGGPLLFIAFLVLVGAAMVRGIQVLKRWRDDRTAPYLVAMVGFLLMFLTFCYVDIGIMSARLTVMFGLVLGAIGTWGRDVALAEPPPTRASARPRLEPLPRLPQAQTIEGES